MSFEHQLQLAFCVEAALWLIAAAFFGWRYWLSLIAIRKPSQAPFLAGAAVTVTMGLLTSGYYLWVLFAPPLSPEIRQNLVFMVPFDGGIGALAFMLWSHWAFRRAVDSPRQEG